MKYKKHTIMSLKFWFWLSMGLDAMFVGVVHAIMENDVKIAVFGAIAMAAQIIHGVRTVFFEKTIGNMSTWFCIFQFMLLVWFAAILAGEMGTYGTVLVIASIVELAVAFIILHRKKLIEFFKELFLL